jgi:DNA ligase (NAD+)
MSTKTAYHAVLAAVQAGNLELSQRLLKEHNDAYYENGSSAMTDPEFDHACKIYTGRFGLVFKTGSVAQKAQVEGHSRHAVHAHEWPLLSGWLAKADGPAEMAAWLTKRVRSGANMIGSPKWDGMSLVFTYSQFGIVKRVLTRGEDGKGVDVTRHFRDESHFGGYDFGVAKFGVKYEAVLSWTDLERMNEDLGGEYKNPRNTIAGIIAKDDSSERRQYVTLVPLEIEWKDMTDDRVERLTFMQQLFAGTEQTTDEDTGLVTPAAGPIFNDGHNAAPFFWWGTGDAEAFSACSDIYQTVHDMRDTCDYMLDGTVIEFAEDQDVERLGGLENDCPDYALAVKFPSMVGRTFARTIDFDTGNTGRRTPCVNYDPITLDGRTFSRTSLANMTRFDQLKLAPGTPILVEIRGDIIGWVDRDGDDPAGAVPFVEPEGMTYTYNRKLGYRVFAYSEAPLEGRVERMVIKCGIKGLRIETARKLVEAGVVTKLSDMWDLEPKFAQIASIPGMGEGSANIVLDAIDRVRRDGLWDWQILASIGINNVGRTLSKEALKVRTLEELLAATAPFPLSEASMLESRAILIAEATQDLVAILGKERGPMVMEGVERCWSDLSDLMHANLPKVNVTKTAMLAATTGQKYKVVVTGDLTHWDRDVFRDYIETLGHKMVGSMSRKVDLLITNTPKSGTKKNKEAQALEIRIVTEQEAIEIMGLTPPAAKAGYVPGAPEAGVREGSLDEL